MTLKQEQSLHALETLIRQRLESALQRTANAQDVYMGRYYKGQADALHVALRDIETTKFENGIELGVAGKETPASVIELRPLARSLEEPAETPEAQRPRETSTRKVKRLPKKSADETELKVNSKPKAEPKEPPSSEYAALASEAIQKGVIVRKASWFFHELLPNKALKGFRKLYQVFEQDVAFRQAIADACAAQPVVMPMPEFPIDTPFEAA